MTEPEDPARARLAAAENVLRQLDPRGYEMVDQWYDKEFYNSLFGAGGCTAVPRSHRDAIKEVLRARVDVYRALRFGTTLPFRVAERTGETSNEFHAQAIEAALRYMDVRDGLPEFKAWEHFVPKWKK